MCDSMSPRIIVYNVPYSSKFVNNDSSVLGGKAEVTLNDRRQYTGLNRWSGNLLRLALYIIPIRFILPMIDSFVP